MGRMIFAGQRWDVVIFRRQHHMVPRCAAMDGNDRKDENYREGTNVALDRRKAIAGLISSNALLWLSSASSGSPACAAAAADGLGFQSNVGFGREIRWNNSIDYISSSIMEKEINMKNWKSFSSREGFAFQYPDSWVLAFDRSGGKKDGAVVVVGDFRQSFLVVSVFRTVAVETLSDGGESFLTVEDGRRLVLDTLREDPTTMRFKEISASSTENGEFDFQYELQTCVGEIQEGSGGVVRCLGSSGQEIPAAMRRAIGRAVLQGNTLLTMTASAPIEKWMAVEETLGRIVSSFHRI